MGITFISLPPKNLLPEHAKSQCPPASTGPELLFEYYFRHFWGRMKKYGASYAGWTQEFMLIVQDWVHDGVWREKIQNSEETFLSCMRRFCRLPLILQTIQRCQLRPCSWLLEKPRLWLDSSPDPIWPGRNMINSVTSEIQPALLRHDFPFTVYNVDEQRKVLESLPNGVTQWPL